MKTRAEAYALLTEFTQSQSLLKHALAVETCMRWYAEKAGLSKEELEKWGMTGLLHDFDYERYPNPTPPDGHPYKGNQILAERGYPDDMRKAIMGHALYTNTPRDTNMAKTLFAVDELSGLVTASVLVRPDKNIHNLEAKSVLKKMKDKAFARGCNRDDIRLGAQELGVELETHIANVITALQGQADSLGLAGAVAA
ncbi:MAG: HAD family hydrolase [Oligoflexia bacterium]|nr:HAD family hydrolase [Oligoflexia bacterium]